MEIVPLSVITIYKQNSGGFSLAHRDMLLTITVSETQETKTAQKLKMKAEIRFLFNTLPLTVPG